MCIKQGIGELMLKGHRRPRLLRGLGEKLSVKSTIAVNLGAGYHLYFKLKHEFEAPKLRRLEKYRRK